MKGLPLLLLATLFASSGFTQTESKEPRLCTIQGQVVADPDGKPVRKVDIQINGTSDDAESHSYGAITDAEGRFKIEKVNPGRYRVTMQHPGFVRSTRRTDRMARSQTSLTIDPSDQVKELVLHVQPAAIILGKVTDDDGDPQQGSVVAVFRFRPNSRRPRGWQGQAITNDLGEVRIGGLPPGKYIVSANPSFRNRLAVVTANKEAKQGAILATTYYPGTTDPQQAAPVELHAGDEVPINIGLISSRAYHVRGAVNLPVPESGDPSVVLEPIDGVETPNPHSQAELDKNGTFDISGVLPGSYVAVMYVNADGNPRVAARSVNVEVTNADVENLHLAPMTPATLQGRIRMDDGARIDWTQLSVWLDPEDDFASRLNFSRFQSENSTVKHDGSFAMKEILPGQYRFVVNSGYPSMRDLYLKSVNLGGKDVVDTGLSLTGGSYSIDAVLSAKGATIEGLVTDAKDQPVPDAMVVAVPDKTLRTRSDAYEQSTTDQHGQFVMHGMIPGEYTLLAFGNLEDDYRDPDFLKTYESRGKNVKVVENQHEKAVLKIIAAPDQE